MDPYEAHFIKLAHTLGGPRMSDEQRHPAIPVTIDQLSELLNCSSRNVKIILRRLEDMRYIHWTPGRGRGHISRLQLLRTPNEVITDAFHTKLKQGNIKAAIDLIGRSELDDGRREQLWLAFHAEMGMTRQMTASGGADVLQMSRYRRLEPLDPALVYTAFEAYLLEQICSTLISYDANSMRFQPKLAHLWEHNDDYTRWTFYLRKGVQFHNGKSFTAEDVKYTVERLQGSYGSGTWQLEQLERVEIHGGHCLSLIFASPNRMLLHCAASFTMSILPLGSDPQVSLIGTGPFCITSLTNTALRLTAYDSYFGYRPLLDEVNIWFLPDVAVQDRRYQLADRDVTHDGTGSLAEVKQSSELSFEYQSGGCRYLVFNFRREGPQHRASVREAIRCVYDPVLQMQELGGSRLSPAFSFLPWRSLAMNSENGWPNKLEDARRLLQESGYAGEELRLAYKMLEKESIEEAEWLRQRCEQIGICLTLVPFETIDFAFLLGQADLVLAEEMLEEDWEWGLINFFKTQFNSLHHLLDDARIQTIEKILEGYSQYPEAQRHDLLYQVEGRIQEHNWLLYGCHLSKKALYYQGLQGLNTTNFGYLDFSKLWIKSPEGI